MSQPAKQKPAIALASLQKCKVRALKSALVESGHGDIEVEAFGVKSRVSNQPFGREETLLGAKNRLAELDEINAPFYAVSMESGIIMTESGPYCKTCVVLRTARGVWVEFSEGHLIPKEAYDEWSALENRGCVTAGSIIVRDASKYGLKENTPSSEWYDRTNDMCKTLLRLFWLATHSQNIDPLDSIPVCDFKGVDFVDIQGPLKNPKTSQALSRAIQQLTLGVGPFNGVAAIEARGFVLLSDPLRERRSVLMLRKPGKLPGKVSHIDIVQEYGSSALEVQQDSIKPGDVYVIVDDVFATGGTVEGAIKLIESCGATVVACIAAVAIVLPETHQPLVKSPAVRRLMRYAYTSTGRDDPFYWLNSTPIEPVVDRLSFCGKSPQNVYIVPRSMDAQWPTDKFPRVPVKWDHFAKSPNTSFMPGAIRGNHVHVVIPNDLQERMEALAFWQILFRHFPASVSGVFPFIEEGTSDRPENRNGFQTVASFDIVSHLLNPPPGQPAYPVTTWDLHCLQTRFTCLNLQLASLVEALTRVFFCEHPDAVVVFPDEGASKRFSSIVPDKNSIVVFSKQRLDDGSRRVTTMDKIPAGSTCVVIDDLVRSGGTLETVRVALKEAGASKVYALFAHAALEPSAKIAKFDGVWTSDSCPGAVPTEWIAVKVAENYQRVLAERYPCV